MQSNCFEKQQYFFCQQQPHWRMLMLREYIIFYFLWIRKKVGLENEEKIYICKYLNKTYYILVSKRNSKNKNITKWREKILPILYFYSAKIKQKQKLFSLSLFFFHVHFLQFFLTMELETWKEISTKIDETNSNNCLVSLLLLILELFGFVFPVFWFGKR